MTTNDIVCALIAGVIYGSFFIAILLLYHKFKKKETTTHKQETIKKPSLTFDECNHIIDSIIDEVYTNKYFVFYRLKEIDVIPKMDEEVTKMTKEIMTGFSLDVLNDMYYYYDREFLIKKITRQVQKLLINYTNTYKPNTK